MTECQCTLDSSCNSIQLQSDGSGSRPCCHGIEYWLERVINILSLAAAGPRNLGFQSTLCLLCYELCWKALLKIKHPLETFIVWTFFETFHIVPKELNRKVDELQQNNKWRLRVLPRRQAVHQAVVNQKLNSPPIMWRQLLLWERSSPPDRIMTFP